MHILRQGLCMLLLTGAVGLYAQDSTAVRKTTTEANKRVVPENLLTVTGRVLDAATRKPIVGARIQMLERAMYSALTNENGLFTIKVPTLSAIVEISAEDYAAREIPLHGMNTLDVVLYSSTFKGLFGTVQTLQGPQSRSSVTSSLNQVNELGQDGAISVESEIAAQLGGDMRANLHSAVPGNGASMFIRGINSLNAMSQPLILVDGVIFDNQLNRPSILQGFFANPINNIDVSDIESVTVLKDGTALYGSKGANGVIMIQTKRGYSQATRIEFNAFMGVNERPKLPDMMNGDQFRKYASELVRGDRHYSDYDKIPWLSDDPARSYYNTYHNETDWTDEVYRTSVMQSYNVSVNGGDESALYNLSVGFTNAPSTIKSSNFNRLNARFNSDMQLYSKLALAMDISYSQTDRKAPDDGVPEDYNSDPVSSVGYLALIKSPFLGPKQFNVSNGSMSPKYSLADVFGVANPSVLVSEDTKAVFKNENNHLNVSATPKFTIMKDLVVSSLFSYTLDKVVGSFFRPEKGTPEFDRGTSFDARNTVKTLSSKQSSIFSDTRLTWKKTFGYSNLNAFLGYRYTTDSYRLDWARADNTANDNINTISAGMKNRYADGVDDDVKTASIYLNADYNWLNKYFLNGSLTFDTSSRFGKKVKGAVHLGDHSWGLFPSIQGAWLISSEDFMKDLNFINYLKLRAGYSITGNDRILNYGYTTYFSAFQFYNNLSGLMLSQIGNETLGWETSHKFNVGLDASLFNDVFSFSVDVYSNRISDLLTRGELPDVTGLDYYWMNNGKMRNNGVDVSVRVKALDLRKFKWELGASLSHYKNKVTSLYNDAPINDVYYGADIRTQVGSSAGLFYGYETNGVFASTSDVPVHGEGADAHRLGIKDKTGKINEFQGGDMWFVDKDGNGVIDENDKTIIGDPNPDFVGTINSHMKWGRLSLDMLFSFSSGNDIYNYLRSQLESGSTYYNQTLAMNRAWSYEGQVTDMPRISYGDPMGNSRFSDRWIEDGSYFRMKTLSLSYEIPLNLTFIQGVTVWAAAHNLFTLTKYLGSDPEVSSSNYPLYQGVDVGLLPQGRSYYLGVKINL